MARWISYRNYVDGSVSWSSRSHPNSLPDDPRYAAVWANAYMLDRTERIMKRDPFLPPTEDERIVELAYQYADRTLDELLDYEHERRFGPLQPPPKKGPYR